MTSIVTHVLVKQNRAHQDYIFQGTAQDERGEQFMCTVIFDGHGDKDCIDFLRAAGKNGTLLTMMGTENPCQTVFQSTQHCFGGSTMNAFRVYANRVENFNVGDSHAILYERNKLGQIVRGVECVDHSFSENERIRLRQRGLQLLTTRTPDITHVVDETTIQVVAHMNQVCLQKANRITGEGPPCMTLSQALGHYGEMGCEPSTFYLDFLPEHSYQCVHASDGVWDVLSERDKYERVAQATCDQLMALTDQRYGQTWRVVSDVFPEYHNQTFRYHPPHVDDRSIAMVTIT